MSLESAMTDKKDIQRVCVVYVAGPYRATTEWKLRKNIEKSADKAMEVWRLNAAGLQVMAVAPCLNSALFGGEVADEVYLKNDLALLLRCDAMVVADGWENSEGVMSEIRFSEENGIPVFYTVRELSEWMEAKGRELLGAMR